MRALTDDFAAVEQHDDIRIADGADTLSNHERRTIVHQSVKRLLNFVFGLCIDGRSAVVEDENLRIK